MIIVRRLAGRRDILKNAEDFEWGAQGEQESYMFIVCLIFSS